MVEKKVVIKNRAGLHARPAALIVQKANEYESQIYLEHSANKINAKSILGIMTLGAGYDSELMVIVDGKDEQDALDSIVFLFESRFEET